METKKGDFVTAIVCSGNKGKAIQCQVTADPQISYRLNIGGFEVEDYEPRYKCYYRMSDDGNTIYATARILEVADNLDELTIDPATIDVPTIHSAPMIKLYEADMEPTDVAYYKNLMLSPAFMYELYLARGKNIAVAQNVFVDEVIKKSNDIYNSLLDSLRDFKDEFGIDEFVDEDGNKIV